MESKFLAFHRALVYPDRIPGLLASFQLHTESAAWQKLVGVEIGLTFERMQAFLLVSLSYFDLYLKRNTKNDSS